MSPRKDHRAFYPRNRHWIDPVVAAVAVAVVMLLMVAPGHCEERVPMAKDAAPLFLAGAVDLGGTEWALAAPGSALREGNPLGQTLSRRVALKAATNAGGLLIVRRLRAGGHPNAAKWTKRGLVAAQVLAGGWAVHQGLRARRPR